MASLTWLAAVNIVLAVFNLLPGAPLDGGRVLRAILWRMRGDRAAAQRAASRARVTIGLLLVGLGAAEMLATGTVDGLCRAGSFCPAPGRWSGRIGSTCPGAFGTTSATVKRASSFRSEVVMRNGVTATTGVGLLPPRSSVQRAPEAVPPRRGAAARPVRRHVPCSFPGLAVAVVFLCLSLTPSLLPRTWQVQGFISGFSAAVGYAVGVVIVWTWGRLLPVRLRRRPSGRAWSGLAVLSAVLLSISLYYGSLWQRDIYRLMDERPPGRHTYLGVLLLSAILLTAAVAVGRALRSGVRLVVRLLSRWIPAALARLTGLTAAALLLVGLLHGVVYDGLLSMARSTSESINNEMTPGASPPTSASRSGSPRSLVSWSSLGMQGRAFVSGGPTVEQLQRFNGAPAKQSIRAYVGLDSQVAIADEAALAVRELHRTGAFSRKVLCVITTTGTGWVDPYAADTLEYLYNGDTAMVGMQYSHLPSWISFLTEQGKVEDAGRELFDQVYADWSALPAGQRPKLLVFGESLGSLGSEATFSGVDDIRNRTDGVLWVGPTHANSLWARFVASRDPGSPEILPTYRQGPTVRFAADPSDLQRPAGPWPAPRVMYLQNPTDPVTWWSPELLLSKPDWLKERRGYGVLPAMRWYPFVTFCQVTADLALADGAPRDHGHSYRRATVAAWAAVAAPVGWTPARSVQLTQLLDGSS